MSKSWKKKLGGIGVISFGSAMLVACGGDKAPSTAKVDDKDQLVECYGVAKDANTSLMMTKGMCDKLPATKQTAVKSSEYVKCYGVAAAGKNDCATKTTSCGGSAKETRQPDAWVSLPSGVCENLAGSSVGKPKE